MEASYATIMYMGNKQVGSTRQQASSWPAAVRNTTKTIDCVGLLRIKRQLKWRLDLQLMAMLYWWVWFLPFINLKTITDSWKTLTLLSCLLVDPFVCTASGLIHVYKNANCLQQLIDENVDEINDNKQSQRRLFFFFVD